MADSDQRHKNCKYNDNTLNITIRTQKHYRPFMSNKVRHKRNRETRHSKTLQQIERVRQQYQISPADIMHMDPLAMISTKDWRIHPESLSPSQSVSFYEN